MSDFHLRSASASVVRDWARWAYDCITVGPSAAPTGRLPESGFRAWRLEPLVYAALSLVDDPRRTPLRRTAREAAGANIIRPMVLRDVLGRFDDAGVHYAIYKGSALVVAHPILRGLRTVSDTDVLVRRGDFRLARRLLLDDRFAEVRSPEPVSLIWNNERLFVRRSPHEVHIDLHRALHRPPLFQSLAEATVRAARRVEGVWIASDDLAPLLIAAHRAKHGYTGDARELLDFRFVVERLDPRSVGALIELAEEHEVVGALYCVWTLVRWWFGHGASAEEAAYSRLVERVGPFREALDILASLDSPFESDKPWRRIPFAKMYLPMPLLTGKVAAPLALAAIHALLRSVDVAVGGPKVLYSVAARRQIAGRPSEPRD